MGTLIAETDIRGRLGTYTLSIYDLSDTVTPLGTFTIDSDVSIKWGESGRDYPKQVLRSYSRITVREGAGDLKDILTGNYNLYNFPTRINGPGVDWLGFPEPSERVEPFNSRVSPLSFELRLVDGFAAAKAVVKSTADRRDQDLQHLVRDAFQQGPTSSNGLSFTDANAVRFDGVFEDKDGNLFDATQDTSTDTDWIVPAYVDETVYERMIRFLLLQRGRIYRSGSEGGIYVHALRETGDSLDYVSLDDSGTQTTNIRPSLVETITKSTAIGDNDRAFEGLTDAGTVEIDLSQYRNLVVKNELESGADFIRLGGDYQLARFGAAEITQNQSGLATVGGGTTILSGRMVFNIGDTGDTDIGTVTIGQVDPVDSLSVVVDWDFFDEPPFDSLEVEIDHGSGTVASETDGNNVTQLIGPPSSSPIDVSVRFIATGGQRDAVSVRVRLVAANEQIIETLVFAQDERSLEAVEPDLAPMPLFEDDGTISTPLRYRPGRDVSLTSDGSDIADVQNEQGFLVQGAIESIYRPFGIFTLQTQLDGLYGPETGLIVEKPDGTNGYFVCGSGRELNLTEGTTRVSDVEIPSAALPSSLSGLL